MLDPHLLRNQTEWAAEQLAGRGVELNVAAFRALDERRKALQLETERLQNERTTRSKSIGQAKASGEDIAPLLAEVSHLGEQLKSSREALQQVQNDQDGLLQELPNLPHESVPIGKDEADNLEIRRWGEPASFDFEAKDHVELGEAEGFLDSETAAKLAGSRFTLLKGPVAKLHRALSQFMLDLHTQNHGYEEINVPFYVSG